MYPRAHDTIRERVDFFPCMQLMMLVTDIRAGSMPHAAAKYWRGGLDGWRRRQLGEAG